MLKYGFYLLLMTGFIFPASPLFGQTEYRQHVREGNGAYEDEAYEDAVKSYKEALEKNPAGYEAGFNLGDALYRQKKYAEAAEQFSGVAEQSDYPEYKARAYHNMGNSLLQAEKYKESIEAYKQALRNNPDDEDTRYNLSYAMKKLKQQQQQQNKKDRKNEDKNEQEDQKKKDQKQQQQDQKEKEKQQQDQRKQQEPEGEQEEKKGQQQRPQRMGKEDARRLLEALQNKEKNVQDKLKKKKAKGKAKKIEKDW